MTSAANSVGVAALQVLRHPGAVPIATLPVAAGSSLDHTDALHAGNDILTVRA